MIKSKTLRDNAMPAIIVQPVEEKFRVPKVGEIIADPEKKTVVKIKEVKGYRPGGIHVVLDDEGHERMIRYGNKAWFIA